MLQEMGIHVWLPPSELEVPLAAPVAVLAKHPAPQAPRVVEPLLTAVAIENVAVSAMNTGARASKPLKNTPNVPASARPAVLAEDIAHMDWATLTDAVAHCQACLLCTDRRAPVFAGAAVDAPQRADWLVVGEPPDDVEERLGAPFADAVGQLLDNMLKAVGVSRRPTPDDAGHIDAAKAAYVTNAVKCRPAVARNPSPQELAVCENFLRREVALVQPKVILAMGRFAAQTLLHGSLPEGSTLPFGKLRGQVYRYQGIPVIVTYHPSYLLRTQADKARAWADLCLAQGAVRRGA